MLEIFFCLFPMYRILCSWAAQFFVSCSSLFGITFQFSWLIFAQTMVACQLFFFGRGLIFFQFIFLPKNVTFGEYWLSFILVPRYCFLSFRGVGIWGPPLDFWNGYHPTAKMEEDFFFLLVGRAREMLGFFFFFVHFGKSLDLITLLSFRCLIGKRF